MLEVTRLLISGVEIALNGGRTKCQNGDHGLDFNVENEVKVKSQNSIDHISDNSQSTIKMFGVLAVGHWK